MAISRRLLSYGLSQSQTKTFSEEEVHPEVLGSKSSQLKLPIPPLFAFPENDLGKPMWEEGCEEVCGFLQGAGPQEI